MKKIEAILIILAFGVSLLSCKKNNDDTTLPSLSGFSINTATPFVREGTTQVFRLDLSQLTTSDRSTPGPLGVAWHITGSARDTVTLDVKTSNPPYSVTLDKTGNYTVTCFLFSVDEKYYGSSVTTSFSVINPETALDGLDGEEIITIGGHPYFALHAGGLTWMGQNLYGTLVGRDYKDCEVVSDIFGRYYTWEEARSVCPDGWRLPTAQEFDTALGSVAGDLMVKAMFQDIEMWPYWPQVKITNAFKFNAIPTGYMDLTTESLMYGYQDYACWWTADELEDVDMGVFRYLYKDQPVIMKGKGSKTSLALNVRCVKEISED